MNHVVGVEQTELLLTGTEALDPDHHHDGFDLVAILVFDHLLQRGVVVPTFERRYCSGWFTTL